MTKTSPSVIACSESLALMTPPLWNRDAPVLRADLLSTGGRVWDAAFRLVDFFEASGPLDALLKNQSTERRTLVNVLELGSGCGWLGAVCARNWNACELSARIAVTVTEQKAHDALDHLERNVDNLKASGFLPEPWVLQVHELSWDEPNTAVLDRDWDLIIGSDLLYEPEGVRGFVGVLERILRGDSTSGKGNCMIYAHTKHRYDTVDELLYELTREAGLELRELRLPNEEASALPDSPPLFSELFPEHRVAILRISR
ncbi:Protein-lysine methyltransferase METTL21B [Porphyridium purpureum]|uniref:Protein-lysine methyltransferase METTL21B n=1 Tax=Porphyridium purpureum TaxID=35688 RepID=A0A5J4YTT4_PORPP|nr:Protein-lysine methyltransferase METTL21B [Porphyridium purpureum]|eukprot:POR0295..scf229_5